MSTTLGPIVPCFTASSSCLLSTMRGLDPPFMGCLPFATSLARSRRSAAGPCKIAARSELRRHPYAGSLAYCCTAFKRAERRGQGLLGGGRGRLVSQGTAARGRRHAPPTPPTTPTSGGGGGGAGGGVGGGGGGCATCPSLRPLASA